MNHDFTCTELVQSCLDIISKHDKVLGAFITVTGEQALSEARIVDEKIKRGEQIGILEGIPYSVKDVILTEGVKTTAGSNMLKDFVAPYDATVIKRMKQAGAIMIGKTNCDAYGHGASNEYSDFFPSRNPWDTKLVPGGSSGGSAVSVSADMAIFSLGGDTGGSIRQPASLSGVTALRVSYGRISRYGGIAYASSFDTIGPITKSAEDAAIVIEALAGQDENDHTTRPEIVPEYSKLLDKKETLTIGIPKEFFPSTLDADVKAKVLESIEILKKLGHTVKEISLPYSTDVALATYNILTRAETSSNLERLDGVRYGHRSKDANTLEELYMNSRAEGFGAENKLRIMLGSYVLSAGYYDAYYKKGQKVRTIIRNDFDRVFKEVDVIVCPTSPTTAFSLGQKTGDPVQMDLSDVFTVSFSLAGIPAISVPCALSKGLPVGMQIAGRYFEEERVLRLAHQYQQASDYHKQKPPL